MLAAPAKLKHGGELDAGFFTDDVDSTGFLASYMAGVLVPAQRALVARLRANESQAFLHAEMERGDVARCMSLSKRGTRRRTTVSAAG